MKSQFKKYAVIGNPIFHSLSPVIFKKFYKLTQIENAKYFRVSGENLIEIIEFLKKFNFNGFNVTSPFKEQIINFLDDSDEKSKLIGAANTVINYNGKLKGYNTDFLAILDLIKKYNINKNVKTLIIGGGGAARACTYALKYADFTNTFITNRTLEKIYDLAKKLNFKILELNKILQNLNEFDFIINTTPLKLDITNDKTLLLNADYSQKIHQKNIIPGKEWLILQAIHSFAIYHNKHIQTLDYETLDLPKKTTISLIGFSGSGKTSIGKILSKKLNYNFIDIDHEIEKQTGKTIEQIFAQNSENKFREIETNILKQIIHQEKTILSCGGGIILNKQNRVLLKKNSLVIWLYSDIIKCIERNNFLMKPPLNKYNQNKDELLIQSTKLFSERLNYYFDTAENIILNNSDLQSIHKRLNYEIDKLQ